MPTGRRIGLPQVEVDPAWLREQFAIYGTECEVPKCSKPADWYRQTDHVLVYLCGEHDGEIGSMSPQELSKFDLMMAEHMWFLWTRKLYTYVNTDSGFQLDASIDARQAELRKAKRADAAAPGKLRRDLRKQMQLSGTKVGAPDDSVIAARNKPELNRLVGKLVTPATLATPATSASPATRKQKTSLVPRLVIPSARFTKPSDNTPDPSKAE